jgi:hypothetical protein|nr:MAG TPA: hypothetical protein [Caudoviricetes sp.]
MRFSKFTELVTRIWSSSTTQRRDSEITISIHSPGSIGASPYVAVEAIHPGFDWDAGQVMIYPAQPLTTLTPEQVNDITESVRKGQSWHAYEAHKKHKAQLENAALEHAKVAGQRDELLAALEEMTDIVSKHTYPQPDKPNSTWGRLEVAKEVISRIKGGAA